MNKRELRAEILTLKGDLEHWKREYHRAIDREEALNKAAIHLHQIGYIPDKYIVKSQYCALRIATKAIEQDFTARQYLKGLTKEQREELLNDD